MKETIIVSFCFRRLDKVRFQFLLESRSKICWNFVFYRFLEDSLDSHKKSHNLRKCLFN